MWPLFVKNPVPLLLAFVQTIRQTELIAERPISPTASKSHFVEIGIELFVMFFPLNY